jgi:UDP-glucose 4-epimerase
VLEAARLAGVQRVVKFSSEAVYGAVTEDVPVKPSTPYAVTKVTTERLGKVYGDRYGLEVVSLRIAQVYRPGNRMAEILGDVLNALTKTGAFELAHGRDHGFAMNCIPKNIFEDEEWSILKWREPAGLRIFH